MAKLTVAQQKAKVASTIKVNGNREITPPKDKILRDDQLDSSPNWKDGGFGFESEVGYSTELALVDPRAFATKKYVDNNTSGSLVGLLMADTSSIVAPPFDGGIIWNAIQSPLSGVSHLFISFVDRNSSPLGGFLETIQVGDYIYLIGSNVSEYQKWQVSAIDVEVDHYDFTVSIDGGAKIFSNDEDISLIIDHVYEDKFLKLNGENKMQDRLHMDGNGIDEVSAILDNQATPIQAINVDARYLYDINGNLIAIFQNRANGLGIVNVGDSTTFIKTNATDSRTATFQDISGTIGYLENKLNEFAAPDSDLDINGVALNSVSRVQNNVTDGEIGIDFGNDTSAYMFAYGAGSAFAEWTANKNGELFGEINDGVNPSKSLGFNNNGFYIKTGSFDGRFKTDDLTDVRTWQMPDGNGKLSLRFNDILCKVNQTYSVTGVTTQIVACSILIPAGTLNENDMLYLYILTGATSSANNKTIRAYFNTSSQTVGTVYGGGTSSQIMTFLLTSGALTAGTDREIIFKNSLSSQQVHPATISIGSKVVQNSSAPTNLTANFAVDQYFIITCQCANAADTINIFGAYLKNSR